ncbi:GroES-like protein [Amylocystis lapponica]|nr:GroES-like protein [Amylocystis lapponica]
MASQNPKTYTAYAFTRKDGPLEKITIDWKDPEPGQIVVKVLACGVCASDEIAKGQHFPSVTYPRIPGHEIVGVVAAVPPAEKKWSVGQRVGSGWHGGHCHTCERCREGDFITCSSEAVNGISVDGGYAEYVTLRSEAVASVPEDLDPAETAPLFCAGITTFNSLRHMDLQPPEVVAVQGIGGLGHLGLQYSRAMGYQTVALSSSAAKKKLALELGAHQYVDGSKEDQAAALQQLGGAKVILCAAPDSASIEKLLPALAVDGTMLFLAIPFTPMSLPIGMLIGKRLSLRGWPSGTAADSEACIRFSKVHGIKALVQTFPLAQANEAYDARASARFRAVIVP